MNFDIGTLSNNLGVVIGGAVLVVVVAIFIFTGGSRKKKGTDTTAAENRKAAGFSDSSKYESKRSILKKIRAIKKPVIKEESTVERLVDFAAAEITDMAAIEEYEPHKPDISPVPDILQSGNTSAAGKTIPGSVDLPPAIGNKAKNPFEMPASSTRDIPPVTEPRGKEENAASGKSADTATDTSKPKEKKKTDDIFSMFTDEETEENETSKFASKLAPVDINRLLRDVEDISKYIRR